MEQDRGALNRFIWLVAAPTAFAVSAWIDIFSSVDMDTNAEHLMLVCTPLLGLLVVLAYAGTTGDWVRMWPLLPFGVCAVVFAASMWDLALEVSREPDGAFIPMLQLGTGLVLPLLALRGGVVSWIGPASVRRWFMAIPGSPPD